MAITADISLMRSDVCGAGGAMRDYKAGEGRGEGAREGGTVGVGVGRRGRGGRRERYGVRHQEEIALLPPALRW